MEKEKRIRLLCVALVATVLLLALILAVAVCGGVPDEGAPEETTRRSLADILMDDLLSPEIFLETLDWGEDTTEAASDGIDQLVGMNGALSAGGGANEDMVVLYLQGEAKDLVYLKMQSFGDYTGRGFVPAEAYPELLAESSADFLPSGLMGKDSRVYTLEIIPAVPLSVLPYYVCEREGEIPVSDVLVQGNEEDSHTVLYMHKGETDLKGAETRVRTFERNYRKFAYDQYLNVDRDTRTYMEQLIAREGFDPADPEVIAKVASFIQNSATYNKRYDPALDGEGNIAVAFLETYREGVCRHYAAAATLLYRTLGIPARYTVGFAATVTPNTERAVTAGDAHAWVEVYVGGFGWQYVEVTGSVTGDGDGTETETTDETGDLFMVELRPAARKKQYDGTPLIHDGELEGFEDFSEMGYTYKAEVVHDLITIGVTVATIDSVTIYDSEGQDVTDRFKIITRGNYIRIYYAELTFESVSYSKVYDGHPLALSLKKEGGHYTDVSFVEGDMPAGMTWDAGTSAELTSVGKRSASFLVKLFMDGKDVTDLYYVTYRYGTLEVTPAPLTLTAGSAEKQYDGTPLTAEYIEYNGNEILDGHFITEQVLDGSQTRIGRSSNVITHVVIRNKAGEDVTGNYAIELVDGVLRVRP